ncbi:MAG: sulfur carrier protein ThiS adenylyltransferase ThiF [Peptoniphilaceae bacterium]|nr:sulfur carrier protein ThiS adenylyltransferase ThiF [Peptoniphilaceae bacterium]MDY6019692.1 sulfur carrier protein ThiS adenylyltransferase ThiF [Anaerococcus sp.]
MEIRDKILKRQDKDLSDLFKKSTISILGCGGLGSNIGMELARAGIGKINLFDYDTVLLSNLNRQNYFISDIGKKKVLATKDIIKRAIPYVEIETFHVFLNKDNMDKYIDGADIFIEAFDSPESKKFIFDYFVDLSEKHLICASGLSGLGSLEDIKIKNFGNITMVGDFKSEVSDGLYSPYLMTIASLEALCALKIIRSENER